MLAVSRLQVRRASWAHAVRPYGEPARLGAGGVRASRKKSELTIVTTPIVQNAVV